eukprot:TRINITY_DN16598_c0_g1_i1.p1 TRINITY_DN16598_c0_g1~~TRINITY_DN16598_c0_g1_i1.p1  ORF type:complete len:559 (+),score=102.47 TRINITY_DN16598_c0_g1_i1:68-1744(+)
MESEQDLPPSWSYTTKKGDTVRFPEHLQRDIEYHYLLREKYNIRLGEDDFVLEFPLFRGVNRTRQEEVRLMRRTEVRTPYLLRAAAEVGSFKSWEEFNKVFWEEGLAPTTVLYFFSINPRNVKDPRLGWQGMMAEVNNHTETHFQQFLKNKKNDFILNFFSSHRISFSQARQYPPNVTSPPPIHSRVPSRKLFRVEIGWYWLNDQNHWEPYSGEHSNMFEMAYISGQTFFPFHGHPWEASRYILNLELMTQNQLGVSLLERRIKRVGPAVRERKALRVLKDTTQALEMATSRPPYWNLEDWKDFCFQEVIVPPGTLEWEKLGGMVHRSFVPVQYTIRRIVRFQNDTLWKDFVMRRIKLQNNFESPSSPPNKRISEHLKQYPIKTLSLDPQTNEYYLFLGVGKECLEDIILNGFDTRLFRFGVSFSEHISRSNEYDPCPLCYRDTELSDLQRYNCTPEGIEPPEGHAVLVVRVMLGDAYVCTNYNNKKTLLEEMEEPSPKRPDSNFAYNSIIAESKHNFAESALEWREFIVYDAAQMYPEYAVYYDQVGPVEGSKSSDD